MLAQRVFDAYPEAAPRSLVLLSDMVEHSARLNVSASGPDDRPHRRSTDWPPRAWCRTSRGVHAYVVGAGRVAGSSDMPADRFLAIQRFWLAYLRDAHADLPRTATARRSCGSPKGPADNPSHVDGCCFPDPGCAARDRAARGLACVEARAQLTR